MTNSKVHWVVNDNGELGVLVDGEYYFLYKGGSLQYGDDLQGRSDDGIALHDDGTPMYVREVGKREFGETVRPVESLLAKWRHTERYMEPLVGDDPPRWKPLPATKAIRHDVEEVLRRKHGGHDGTV